MLIADITKKVNQMLAGELLTYAEMLPHLDYTIDCINEKLGACYPAFSDLPQGATEYTAFPDKYIRSVVVIGTAWRYYVTDEEGLQTAPQYEQDFLLELFKMQRDMLYKVPAQYQSDVNEGSVAGDIDSVTLGDRGLVVTYDWPQGGYRDRVGTGGSQSTTLKYEDLTDAQKAELKGEQGEQGEAGYTPMRGVDYWTEEDVAEIKAYVDSQIGGALNGSY